MCHAAFRQLPRFDTMAIACFTLRMAVGEPVLKACVFFCKLVRDRCAGNVHPFPIFEAVACGYGLSLHWHMVFDVLSLGNAAAVCITSAKKSLGTAADINFLQDMREGFLAA